MIIPVMQLTGASDAVPPVSSLPRDIDALISKLMISGHLIIQFADPSQHVMLEAVLAKYSVILDLGHLELSEALGWLNKGAGRVFVHSRDEDYVSQLPKGRTVMDVTEDIKECGDSAPAIFDLLGKMLSVWQGLCDLFFVRLPFELTAEQHADMLAQLSTSKGEHTRFIFATPTPTCEHVALHDQWGCDSAADLTVLGVSLDLGEAIAAPMQPDRPDRLVPTCVVDEQGVCLGMVYSNMESIREAVACGLGVYHSRKRGLWRKGLTSGDTQVLLRIDWDCDRDTLRFTVRQHGRGFCHLATRTCFGPEAGLGALMRTLEERRAAAPAGSYTHRLYTDEELLHSKIREEAQEVVDATTPNDVAWETADLMYFALVKCVKAGVSLADVERQLDRRALKVFRRPGNAKPQFMPPRQDPPPPS
mmetsp:Transcript_8046/g.20289  ORF Transcript_8046/g.20289 Transcript_8046/m.20289 type:complete len:419 (+) Transcript_8046:387-1643(+)